MKNTGKTITTILLIIIFGLGIFILFVQADKMDQYLKLCQFVVPLIAIVMGGVAGKSIAQVIKGEKKVEEVDVEGK